jgi:hypothetical protein
MTRNVEKYRTIRALSAESARFESLRHISANTAGLVIDCAWHIEQDTTQSPSLAAFPELIIFTHESTPLRILITSHRMTGDTKQLDAFYIAREIRTQIEAEISASIAHSDGDSAQEPDKSLRFHDSEPVHTADSRLNDGEVSGELEWEEVATADIKGQCLILMERRGENEWRITYGNDTQIRSTPLAAWEAFVGATQHAGTCAGLADPTED